MREVTDRLTIEEIRNGNISGFIKDGRWYVDDGRPDTPVDSGGSVVAVQPTSDAQAGSVAITAIKIPFWSLVGFMVKWSIATIPAVIILAVIITAVAVPIAATIAAMT